MTAAPGSTRSVAAPSGTVPGPGEHHGVFDQVAVSLPVASLLHVRSKPPADQSQKSVSDFTHKIDERTASGNKPGLITQLTSAVQSLTDKADSYISSVRDDETIYQRKCRAYMISTHPRRPTSRALRATLCRRRPTRCRTPTSPWLLSRRACLRPSRRRRSRRAPGLCRLLRCPGLPGRSRFIYAHVDSRGLPLSEVAEKALLYRNEVYYMAAVKRCVRS